MGDDDETDKLYQEALDLHAQYHGKIESVPKSSQDKEGPCTGVYPGVAEVCRAIAKDRDFAYRYTMKANTVAIVTDGSAVLGLGNIGGYAAIPVMEEKRSYSRSLQGSMHFPSVLRVPIRISSMRCGISLLYSGESTWKT